MKEIPLWDLKKRKKRKIKNEINFGMRCPHTQPSFSDLRAVNFWLHVVPTEEERPGGALSCECNDRGDPATRWDNIREKLIKFNYISKATKKGSHVLRMSPAIPVVRINIRCDINLFRTPRDKAAFNRYLHGISIKYFKQVRNFETRSTEVVKQRDLVRVITVEPLATWVNVQIVNIRKIFVDCLCFTSASSAPVNDHTANPTTA